jgi:hypothetical protein
MTAHIVESHENPHSNLVVCSDALGIRTRTRRHKFAGESVKSMNAIRNFIPLFIACASLNAATIPPAPNQYFNDYAGVIAAPSVAFFNDLLARFERETSNQIVVAIYP